MEENQDFLVEILKEKGSYGAAEETLGRILIEASLAKSSANKLHSKCEMLIQASKQTLRENRHLTDGENCTLKVLKDAIESLDIIWED